MTAFRTKFDYIAAGLNDDTTSSYTKTGIFANIPATAPTLNNGASYNTAGRYYDVTADTADNSCVVFAGLVDDRVRTANRGLILAAHINQTSTSGGSGVVARVGPVSNVPGIQLNTTTSRNFELQAAGNTNVTSSNTFNVNEWQGLAVFIPFGSGAWQFYANGSPVATVSNTVPSGLASTYTDARFGGGITSLAATDFDRWVRQCVVAVPKSGTTKTEISSLLAELSNPETRYTRDTLATGEIEGENAEGVAYRVRLGTQRCSLNFGTSPCTASGSAGTECYNSYATCQDRANIALQTEYVDFVPAGQRQEGALPIIESYSVTAPRSELGKLPSAGAWTFQLAMAGNRDTANDDKYISTRADTDGAWLSRFIARQPYLTGLPAQIVYGDTTLNLRIASLLPTGNGKAELILTTTLLTRLATTLYAGETQHRITADMTNSQTNISIYGWGAADFAQGDYISVDGEVIYLASADTSPAHLVSQEFATVTRGALGTEAAAHSAWDIVNRIWFISDRSVGTAIEDVLLQAGYADGDIDSNTISAANTAFPGISLTGGVDEETTVRDVLEDILRLTQTMLVVNPALDTQLSLVADPWADTAVDITEDQIVDLRVEDLSSQFATRVIISGNRNAINGSAYHGTYRVVDAFLESTQGVDENTVLEIKTSFLDDGGVVELAALGWRARSLRNQEKAVRIRMEVDGDLDLTPGTHVTVTAREFTDYGGQEEARTGIVISQYDVFERATQVVEIDTYEQPISTLIHTADLTAGANKSVRTAISAASGEVVFAVITVPSGVTVGASSTDKDAINCDNLGVGSVVRLVVSGTVNGGGGNGGGGTHTAGYSGGEIMRVPSGVQAELAVKSGGTARVGGGGGGVGYVEYVDGESNSFAEQIGGSGGQGSPGGTGGSATGSVSGLVRTGGSGSISGAGSATNSASGGAWGENGVKGQNALIGGTLSTGFAGGASQQARMQVVENSGTVNY